MSGSAAESTIGERPRRARSLTVVLGAMIAFPYALPLTPVLQFRSFRWLRSDLWWAAAVVIFAVVSLATGGVRSELLMIMIGFLAFKGGQSLTAPKAAYSVRSSLGGAFVLAHVGLLGYSLVEAVLGGSQRISGPSWFGHPNLFAPALLVVGFAAAGHVGTRWRWIIVAGTLVGLVLSGSRSSLLGFFVVLVLAALLDKHWRRTAIVTLGVGAVIVLLVSIALPGRVWAQRILSPIYAAIGVERSAKNLLILTEELGNRTHWNAIGVDTALRSERGVRPAVWTVARVEPVAWARPQQAVEVSRGEPYTLSVVLKNRSGEQPGLIGWAAREGTQVSFEVGLNADRAEVLQAAGLETATARVVELDDGWRRLEFTFSVAGAGTATIGVGVSPTLESERINDAVDVRELQLEPGRAATTYEQAIHRATGVGEALARGTIFKVAWQGVREAPIFGQGSESFAGYYVAREGIGVPPSHAHNAFLQVTFGSGFLGLVALMSVLVALFVSGGPLQKALLLGMCMANLFDSTFTAGVVFYLLAFVMAVRITARAGSGAGY